MSALGYYIPGERDRIDIQFLPKLEGYIWVFPRCGHLSVGICGKGEPASALRARLERYMDEQGLSKKGATFYSHLLPCLGTPAWKTESRGGRRLGWRSAMPPAWWIPSPAKASITRSGPPISRTKAILSESPDLAGAAYRKLIRRDFMADLEFGSRLANRVFHGTFLWGAVTSRMVQFTRLSPKFRGVMQDLFAGTQPYAGSETAPDEKSERKPD